MLKRMLKKAAMAVATFGLFAASPVQAQETVKVGVLHSLSGTMAISETSLRDVVLMAVEEINGAGGVKVAARVHDRAGRRRPGLQLAAVRRKGQAADRAG